ncbi:MAG TPA: hypothetical protein VGK63_00220, partial [Candidatus Limnocylindrales bacterium]
MSGRQPLANVASPSAALPPTAAGVRRLDATLALASLLLAAGSAVVWSDPAVPRVVRAPEADVAINVTATLVGAAVATLAWVRWRETAEVASLYECSAFVVLSATNALLLSIVVLGAASAF